MNFLSRCLYRVELALSREAREQHCRMVEALAIFERWPAVVADIERRGEEIEPGFWKRMAAEKRVTHPWLFATSHNDEDQ